MNIQIGENLKKLRREREITQEELANALGTSPQSVSNWERGDCYPDMELVPRIARYFDVTLDELFGLHAVNEKERIDELMRKQRELLRSRAPDATERTEALLREAVLDFPKNYMLHINLAQHVFSQGSTPEEIVASGRETARILERMMESCTDTFFRSQADSLLVRAYTRAGETQKAIEHARSLPDSLFGRENALRFMINFDKRYHDFVTKEETTRELHYQVYTAAGILSAAIATIRGDLTDEVRTNYLDGEPNTELVAAYGEAQELMLRLLPLLHTWNDGQAAIMEHRSPGYEG